jgi:hypothetical protein
MAHPFQSCAICEAEAAGRCPRCRQVYCIEHFPRHAHALCAGHLAAHAADYVCYVCGEPVVPEQYSTAIFAHYIDGHTCSGCNRYICDEHTRRRDEQVKIVQDGMRSHRYNVIVRSCRICYPLRNTGGLIGTAWWIAGLITVALAIWFIYHG